MDEVNLGSHEDELVETAIFEVNFSKPTKGVDMKKPRFLTDFANGRLLGRLARLDVALGDGPAIL